MRDEFRIKEVDLDSSDEENLTTNDEVIWNSND